MKNHVGGFGFCNFHEFSSICSSRFQEKSINWRSTGYSSTVRRSFPHQYPIHQHPSISHLWGFLKWAYPQSSSIFIGFSMKSTILSQLGVALWKAPKNRTPTTPTFAVRHPTWILLRFLEGLMHGQHGLHAIIVFGGCETSQLAVETNFYCDQEWWNGDQSWLIMVNNG